MLGLKRRPPINEVVFADDFFRARENGLLAAASAANRKFLRGFFGTAASRLGWRVREVGAQSQGGDIPVAELMKALDLPCSPDGWAAACNADLDRGSAYLTSMALTPSSLVIGWGLPPSVTRYVDNQGAAFIDVEIHSIRFTRDLHLAVRTNDPGIRKELERLQIDEESFWSAAAGLRGHFARRGEASIVRSDLSVGLFVGQMEIDLAAVREGRLTRPVDFIDQLAQWAQQVDLLAIRPHPAQQGTEQLHAVLDGIPNAVLVGSNTYSLLCAENLAFVGAVSSGVLHEASYLGCNDIRRLIMDDRNNAYHLPATCSPWIPVSLEVASAGSLAAFARARQGERQPPVERHANQRPSAFPEDMLNNIFVFRWGLDPAASGLPALPTLAAGQTLNLAVDTPGATSAIFGRGWHCPEPWGVWSAEEKACLVVLLSDEDTLEAGSTLDLTFHGHTYSPGDAVPPTVRIMVNGAECELRRNDADGMEWSIRIDPTSIENRLLTITVDVRGALRPCDVGGNPADIRAFGLGLRHIKLEEISEPRAREHSEQQPEAREHRETATE